MLIWMLFTFVLLPRTFECFCECNLLEWSVWLPSCCCWLPSLSLLHLLLVVLHTVKISTHRKLHDKKLHVLKQVSSQQWPQYVCFAGNDGNGQADMAMLHALAAVFPHTVNFNVPEQQISPQSYPQRSETESDNAVHELQTPGRQDCLIHAVNNALRLRDDDRLTTDIFTQVSCLLAHYLWRLFNRPVVSW